MTAFLKVLYAIVLGSITWDFSERLLAAADWKFDLSLGPVGFNLSVVAIQIEDNLGTLPDALGGSLLV